jgi:hypothetical protein
VLDNGVGIPPEMLPSVFEMFAQVNRTLGRSQGGLGIGLALVRHLVALHGGSVEAHSGGDGKGSEFVVRLPLPNVRARPAKADGNGAVLAGASRRVLVVDDNADAAESLAQLLALKGHEVRVAYDGLSGVELARAFEPDVIHAHWWFPNGLVGTWTARMSDKPLVTTLHGTDVRLARTVAFSRPGFRHVLQHSAAVTAVSQFLADDALCGAAPGYGCGRGTGG